MGKSSHIVNGCASQNRYSGGFVFDAQALPGLLPLHLSASQETLDELRRDLRDNRISIGAQASHSGGNPMSQRECAGFNGPLPAVPAQAPIDPGPKSINCAWRGN
jgi:hypothetical protein